MRATRVFLEKVISHRNYSNVHQYSAIGHSERLTSQITSENQTFWIDYAKNNGGKGLGATPIAHLMASALACSSVVCRSAAKDMKIVLNGSDWNISSELDGSFSFKDSTVKNPWNFVKLKGFVATSNPQEDLDQLALEITKRCPVMWLFHASGVKVEVILQKVELSHFNGKLSEGEGLSE